MKQCPFCDWREIPNLRERLILETTGFVVVASLGQIVPGYVNIFPKRHVACFAELTVPELAEFVLLKDKLTDAMVGVYGALPACFEHGVDGQLVGHAHVHLTPVLGSIASAMFIRIKSDYEESDYMWLAGWKVFAHIRDRFQRYLLFEHTSGEMFVFPTVGVEVQPGYLRWVLAEVVGEPEWADWRSVDPERDAERWRETRDLLSAYLESAGIPLK